METFQWFRIREETGKRYAPPPDQRKYHMRFSNKKKQLEFVKRFPIEIRKGINRGVGRGRAIERETRGYIKCS